MRTSIGTYNTKNENLSTLCYCVRLDFTHDMDSSIRQGRQEQGARARVRLEYLSTSPTMWKARVYSLHFNPLTLTYLPVTIPCIVATDPENEAGSLDDTPLKFLTVRSFLMGILVSMGGFIFGYDTGACLHPGRPKGREAKSEAHRSDIGLSRDARFPPTLRYSCSQ